MTTLSMFRVHRGVYAFGRRDLTREGRWLAAVLACGDGAVLSHRSAAALWGIGVREGKAVAVTAPRSRHGSPGIELHRTRVLPADDVTNRRGVPTTTLPRTLADLADVLTEPELARAIHQAEVTHSLAARSLHEVARRAQGRRGVGRLRRAIGDNRDCTRSELERRFLRLCDRHGLPRPETNVEVAGLEVDFLWREERLVVELDGWRFHRTRLAFEQESRPRPATRSSGFPDAPVHVSPGGRRPARRRRDGACR
jgi:hypothetical protein